MVRRLARQRPEPEPEPEPEVESGSPDASIEPLLYNTDDACFMLGKISKPMLFRLITQKKLHPTKVGSRSMFTKRELERYVRQCEEETQAG